MTEPLPASGATDREESCEGLQPARGSEPMVAVRGTTAAGLFGNVQGPVLSHGQPHFTTNYNETLRDTPRPAGHGHPGTLHHTADVPALHESAAHASQSFASDTPVSGGDVAPMTRQRTPISAFAPPSALAAARVVLNRALPPSVRHAASLSQMGADPRRTSPAPNAQLRHSSEASDLQRTGAALPAASQPELSQSGVSALPALPVPVPEDLSSSLYDMVEDDATARAAAEAEAFTTWT